VVAFGFEQFRLREIIGLVHPENVASVRVLEKLGLRFVETMEYRGQVAATYVVRGEPMARGAHDA
jgi:RimJ/RimL family protein N-acetyltransferase